jgi:hydrogenase nickel incorporation protein HypB
MCRDCGCETANKAKQEAKTIALEAEILAKNDSLAKQNREYFDQHHIRVVNIISSPGSGKTLLLEKTLKYLKNTAVIIGDQEQSFDADRIAAQGGRVLQLNTHSSCHLNAQMIYEQLDRFITPDLDLLIIENVGNLVCPAAFYLGEHAKIAILSTPEGEEKPIKYPVLFHEAQLIVINKIDLADVLDWNREKCLNYIRKVNPKSPILELSAKTEKGISPWINFLKNDKHGAKIQKPTPHI